MRIGIDLDNTIISYDRLFAKIASERQLVPANLAANKQAIRDFLRRQGQEDEWTEMQGIAYGHRIQDAVPFDGVKDFLLQCEAAGVDWCIISHRSLVPYSGEPVDLHAAARSWLVQQGFVQYSQMARVLLAIDRESKMRNIVDAGCDVFIDDLPELLLDPAFPQNVRRILFDPMNQNADHPDYTRAASWKEISNRLLGTR